MAMGSPYGMELVEDCLSCKLCAEGFFCHLPKSVMQAFQPLKFTLAYPAGATLFAEGQVCRGIYILCKGRVKLSASSRAGQTLIFKIAQPGEVLGLNAAVSGIPHETTAETGQPCQLNFVKRDDFLKFLTQHGDACLHAAIHSEPRVPTGVPAPSLVRTHLSTRANCPLDAGLVARRFQDGYGSRNQSGLDP